MAVAAKLAVAMCFAWLFPVWLTHRVVAGDTPWLVDGTDALVRCLHRGDLDGCGFTGELNSAGQMSPIAPYPLLQYLPDLLARSLGATHDSRYTVLALLSTAAVAAFVVIGRMVLRRTGQAPWFWGFVLVVLSGPVLAYASTTWGEMLASALLVCLVAAVVLQAPPAVVAAAAFAACLTKETSYPFVIAIGLLGLVLGRRRTARPVRAHVLWGAGGVALAVACASLFNVVRFGSVTNTNYLDAAFRAPLEQIPESALGLFLSPNGGILVFWASATVLMTALLLLPFARRVSRFDRYVALALAAVVAGLTLSLASWWAPYGWVAWGPRLSVPWVLPLVLLGLVAFGRPLGDLTARLLASRRNLFLVAVALVIVTLPHVGYMWRPESITTTFFVRKATDEHCKTPGALGSSDYYACLHDAVWARDPIVTEALAGLEQPGAIVTALLLAGGLLGGLTLLRTELGPARLANERREGRTEGPAVSV